MKKTLLLSLISVLACGVLVSNAFALTTTINPRWAPVGTETAERNLEDILNDLYGAGNYVRIDDDMDKIWKLTDVTGEVSAQAKYAGYGESFGYVTDSTPFDQLFFVPSGSWGNFDNGDNPDVMKNKVYTDTITAPIFKLAIDGDGKNAPLWTSDFGDNGGEDHMVTFKIINGDSKGNYVVGWEDVSMRFSDRDYNDLVVELKGMKPVPEPGTVILLGIGLLGMGIIVRKRS